MHISVCSHGKYGDCLDCWTDIAIERDRLRAENAALIEVLKAGLDWNTYVAAKEAQARGERTLLDDVIKRLT